MPCGRRLHCVNLTFAAVRVRDRVRLLLPPECRIRAAPQTHVGSQTTAARASSSENWKLGAFNGSHRVTHCLEKNEWHGARI